MKPFSYYLINKLIGFFVFCFLLLFSSEIAASGDIFPQGARAAGMGRTSVAIKGFWGIQNNQAAIALMEKYAVGLHYESRFGLNEIAHKSIAVIAPVNFGVLGLSFNHYGFSNYNEMKVGLAYARSFSKYFRFGLQLDYLSTNIGDNYGTKNNVTFEIGIQSDLSENLCIGAYAFNPIMVKLAEYNQEKLASVYRLGLAYKFGNWLLSSVEVEKSSNINPLLLRLGLEYSLKSKFFFRAGIASRHEIFTFGFGMKFKYFSFDIAASMHESMGFSPQFSFIVNF
jgi:hypothetical protein